MRTRTVLIVLAVVVALGQAAFAKHGRNDNDDRHPGPNTRFDNNAERGKKHRMPPLQHPDRVRQHEGREPGNRLPPG